MTDIVGGDSGQKLVQGCSYLRLATRGPPCRCQPNLPARENAHIHLARNAFVAASEISICSNRFIIIAFLDTGFMILLTLY